MSIEHIKQFRRHLQEKKQSKDEIFAKKSFGLSYVFYPSLRTQILFSQDSIKQAQMIVMGELERNLPINKPVRRKASFSRSIHPFRERVRPRYYFKPYTQKPFSEEVKLQNSIPSLLDFNISNS